MNEVIRRLSRLQRRFPLAQTLALVGLFVYGSVTIDGFEDPSSIRSMLVLAALLGLAAAGQTLVMILGGLDLSIPGFIVGGAILISQLCGTDHWPLAAALALIVVIALALGASSGWICHRHRIQPLIVTLAMGSIVTGAAVAWTKGTVTGAAPASIARLTTADGSTFGLPIAPVVVIWGVVAVLVGGVLHRTVSGRRLYATGDNPRAASLILIRTQRVWMATFAASAVIAALVGVLLAGFGGADPSIGDPYLFEGLTAVIIGGTTIMGARGDYTHTVLGALILTELTTILVGLGLDSGAQEMVFGALILIVVAAYGREPRLRDRV